MWLALRHKDNVTLGVASDGALQFRQPTVVLTGHVDHSQMFYFHCLKKTLLKFHNIKTVTTSIQLS
jgi:hypothetical protein